MEVGERYFTKKAGLHWAVGVPMHEVVNGVGVGVMDLVKGVSGGTSGAPGGGGTVVACT